MSERQIDGEFNLDGDRKNGAGDMGKNAQKSGLHDSTQLLAG